MPISKHRLIALGQDQIKQKGGTKADQESYAKRVLKKFGAGMASLISHTPTKCECCAAPLNINNGNQVVRYCSKACRKAMRHHNKRR